MNVIVEERRYDAEYLASHAEGFEELRAHLAGTTPEWAWPLTGLRPELIRESARFIASARPASLVHPGRHATWTGDDTQRSRAMAILAALLGSWGRRGGYLATGKVALAAYPLKPPASQTRPVADRPKQGGYPVAEEVLASGLCDATRPGFAAYDLKAWIVYGTNLIQSLPAPEETIRAIQDLDLLVAIDVLPAEICGWADVVLPEATYLERDDDLSAPAYKQPFVAIRQAAVEPMYDSRPGWWIAKEMGKRVGLEEWFPWKDGREYVDARLRASGLDAGALRRKGALLGERIATCEEEGAAPPISTQSGKIQLLSSELGRLGFDALPAFYPPDEGPPGTFRLLMGRAPTHTFGRTANNRLLAEPFPENEVWVNADVARSLPTPVKNGDWVMLTNQDGVKAGPVRAKVTQRIRGDCVYMVHGWGHTARGLSCARGRGASTSQLTTRYRVDPIMGGTGMNVNFVKIELAERSA
jgi:thiosulfate reductase/polysulfide reductase chain A